MAPRQRLPGRLAREPSRVDRRPARDPRPCARFAAGDRAARGGVGSRRPFPRELFAELGELGLMGVCVPEEHGGAGANFLAYVPCSRSSRAPTPASASRSPCTRSAAHAADRPPRHAGADRESSCRRWPRGEVIGAFALTESGSRLRRRRVRTRRPTDGGASPAPSSGSPTARYAGHVIVFAARGRARRSRLPGPCRRRRASRSRARRRSSA